MTITIYITESATPDMWDFKLGEQPMYHGCSTRLVLAAAHRYVDTCMDVAINEADRYDDAEVVDIRAAILARMEVTS